MNNENGENHSYEILTCPFDSMLKDIKREHEAGQKFCFILGAGASVGAGIKSGSGCAKEWIAELKNNIGEEEYTRDIKERIECIKKQIEYVLNDEEKVGYINVLEHFTNYQYIPNLAACPDDYFASYDLRYCREPQKGKEYFLNLVQGKFPMIGQMYLAKILTEANPACDIVVTLNFDNLIESAVRKYTEKEPFVIGHEQIAEYASEDIPEHPRILKLHRDVMFGGFNSKKETSSLDRNWEKSLTEILKTYVPIVIGYAGTDKTLMDFFEHDENKGIYWCFRMGEYPNKRVRDVIRKRNGRLVEIYGFDNNIGGIADSLGVMPGYFMKKENHLPDNYRHLDDRPAREQLKKKYYAEKEALVKQNIENAKLATKQQKFLSMFFVLFGYFSYRRGLLRLAEYFYCKAIANEPIDRPYIAAIHNLGKVFDETSRIEAAMEKYSYCWEYYLENNERMTDLDEKRRCYYAGYNYARDLFRVGEFDKSERQFCDIENFQHADGELYLYRAYTRIALNKTDEAIRDLKHVIEIEGIKREEINYAKTLLAASYLMKGREKDAEEILNRLTENTMVDIEGFRKFPADIFDSLKKGRVPQISWKFNSDSRKLECLLKS